MFVLLVIGVVIIELMLDEMLISVIFFIAWVLHSLVSVAILGYYQSVVAVGSLVESASACWWVPERNRDGIGERRLRGAEGKS